MAKKQQSGFSRQLKRGGQFFVYLIFRALEAVLRVMPLPLIARAGNALGTLGYYLGGKYRELALRNLRIAFGQELEEEDLRFIARKHFASVFANVLCSIKLPLMSEADVLKHVTVEGAQYPAAVAAQGKPILYAATHMSCWELLTQVPSVIGMGKQITTVYQPLSNPFLDAHLRRNREKHGYIAFDRNDGFSGPMKHLREHKSVLGILVDQHAGDKGVWCPFFGRLASTTPLPALLSLRCDTPLIPLIVNDNGPGRWKIIFYPPVQSREKSPSAEGLTAELNLALEQVVRAMPFNNFWMHNRWKTPKPEFLLLNYRRGITMPQGFRVDQLKKFEIIIRSPNWLGDACMAFPAVRALREGRPDLRLTVFTPAKLAQLWQSLGIVDEIITKEGKEGVFSVAKRIRNMRRYDAGILFTNSTRSTLEFWLAGIPRLVGFKGSLRSKLLHQITPEQKSGTPPEHQAHKYLRLARHCGAVVNSPGLFNVDARIPSADGRIRVGICAGAEYGQAKRWPLERYAEVANAIPQVEWVLFGAPGEAAMGEQLASMLRVPHMNLVGKTSMDDLIQCLRECTLLVTNDTGTMHLAAAIGVPTVSIFGSTEPILTGPLGAQHSIVRHHVPCSPCFKRECPLGHYDCMTGITSQRVVQVVVQQLTALTQPR